MNLKNPNHFSPSRVKALFGLQPNVLAEVLFKVLPVLERRRAERLASRPDRKRRMVSYDGRAREVKPYQKVLMALMYLRHNVSQEGVGGLFGFSADTSENAFHDVVPRLRELFPVAKWDAQQRW